MPGSFVKGKVEGHWRNQDVSSINIHIVPDYACFALYPGEQLENSIIGGGSTQTKRYIRGTVHTHARGRQIMEFPNILLL